jgi:hypothetical protein
MLRALMVAISLEAGIMMRRITTLGLIGFGVVMLTSLASAASGLQHKVAAEAVASSITTQDGKTTAKFVVRVSNYEDVAIADFKVVFSEDFQVTVGGVAAGATATSGSQVVTVDVADSPTQSLLLPVTYTFSIDGANVEKTSVLMFRRAE